MFAVFDVDGSQEIDKQEAVKHWKSKFGKLSAMEFFNQVDVNKDGTITFEEFLTFWAVVKESGHSEEDILEELENIKNGESWAGFNNLPEKYQRHAIKHNKQETEEDKSAKHQMLSEFEEKKE